MIEELLFPSHSDLDPQLAALLRGTSKEVTSFLVKKEAADWALDRMTGAHESRHFADEANRLNVLLMKKKLGIPLTDDDYEKMTNKSLVEKMAPIAMGQALAQSRGSVMAGLPETVGAEKAIQISIKLPETAPAVEKAPSDMPSMKIFRPSAINPGMGKMPGEGFYNLAKKAVSTDLKGAYTRKALKAMAKFIR